MSRIILLLLVIVIIAFFAIQIISYNYYIRNSHMAYPSASRQSSLIGGSTNSTLSTALSRHNITLPSTSFPNVGVLTNHVVSKHPLSDFVVLEKTDGVRHIIVIDNRDIFIVVNDHLEPLPIKLPANTPSSTAVLDSECYGDIYYIYDAPFINDDITSLPYRDRYDRCQSYVSAVIAHPSFVMKDISPVTSIHDLIHYVETTEISPTTSCRIDGAIVQLVNAPYYPPEREYVTFKLKRRVMNTIDFLIIYEPSDRCYYLYLSGRGIELALNRRLLPRINRHSIAHVGVDPKQPGMRSMINILFASPYAEGLHRCRLPLPYKWNTSGFPQHEIDKANNLIKTMRNDPQRYSGKIVEMALSEDGWIPLRVRSDKTHPNAYRVGVSNCGVMFSPVKSDAQYFSPKLDMDDGLVMTYHHVNHIMRQFVAERCIRTGTPLSMFDVAGGRGGDIVNLLNNGVTKVFVVDSDADALVRYVEKAGMVGMRQYEQLLPDVMDCVKYRSMMVNVTCGMLGDDDNEMDRIVNDLKGRLEFPKDGVDVALMNFAIHYLCHRRSCVRSLKRMLTKMLRSDGVFVMTYFDGDRLMRDMKDGVREVGPFRVEMVANNDERIEMESDDDAKWALMALPTIAEDGYRLEPLVTDVMLKELGMKTIHRYRVLEECMRVDTVRRKLESVDGFEKVKGYLDYVVVEVFTL